MRTKWLSCGFLLLAASALQARDRLVIEASLNAEARTIAGCATYEIGAKGTGLEDLRFQLYPNLNCTDDIVCVMHIDSLAVNGTNLSSRIVVNGTDLRVPLEAPILQSHDLVPDVWFTTSIPGRAPRLGFADGQFTLTGWYPLLAPWRDSRWQKVVYREFLEPAADLFDIQATITFPDSLELIAPGIAEIDTSGGLASARISLLAASGVPLFLAKGYHIDSTTIFELSLKLYYRKNEQFIVDSVRAAATAALEYMSDYVCPYPFDELVIVIGGLSEAGGLEQPRMILTSAPPRASATRLYADMVIHEVVHQWFYGVVNSNQAEAPWLDEAVTEYLTLKIGNHRARGTPDILDVFGMSINHLTLNRMAARSVMETDALTRRGDRFYDRTTYYATVYNKGTLVLKTLGALMGKDGERQFWQEYADSFKYAVPQPTDFACLADKYLPLTGAANALSLLEHTAATDFAVVSLSAEQIAATPASVPGGCEDSLVWRSSIEYLAKHPLGFPVDFRVEFHDGSVVDTVLTPESGLHKIEYTAASPAVAAFIDPEYKYALDTDYLNNSLARERSEGAALRLFSGVTFLVESLFSTLWGW